MRTYSARRLGLASILSVTALAVAACGSSSSDTSTGSSTSASSSTDWSTVTSVSAGGGMDALVAAAKKEGKLNVIALPHTWTNYGKIIAAFKAKYPGITVNEANPDGSSQDEINAITGAADPKTAPDVVDVGEAVAYANQSDFTPYQVTKWSEIPANLKESSGLFYNDYSGHMVIGYDSSKVKVNSLDDLLGKGVKFGLSGSPSIGAAEGENAAIFASLVNGGSVTQLQPGIDWFKKAVQAGTYYKDKATQDVLAAGDVNAMIGWDYNQAAIAQQNPNWKLYVDPKVSLAGPYYQAISKTAPDPAAARLWEEFLYSDAGQNFYYTGGGYPARGDAMAAAGTLQKSTMSTAVPSGATVTVPTPDDLAKDADAFTNWDKSIGD